MTNPAGRDPGKGRGVALVLRLLPGLACAALFADCFNTGKPAIDGFGGAGESQNFVDMRKFMVPVDNSKFPLF